MVTAYQAVFVFTVCHVYVSQGVCPQLKAYPTYHQINTTAIYQEQTWGTCVFPFQNNKEIHTKCLNENCALTSNVDQDKKWGACRDPIVHPGGNVTDRFCSNECENARCDGFLCWSLNSQSLCFQEHECVMSCASMNDGPYRSCKACSMSTVCSGGMLEEQTCPSGMVYHELQGCVDDAGSYCLVPDKGVMSRILCKTYLSDHQPLCKYASQVQKLSVIEIILQDSNYYINNCTYNSTEYLGTLNTSHLLAIRQRPDLMFGEFTFDFDKIYTSESLVRWEVHNEAGDTGGQYTKSSQEGQDFTEYPRLFHLTYACISQHEPQVLSMQTDETVEGMNMVYIESNTGLFKNWSSVVYNKPIYEPLHHRSCVIKISGTGRFYIGGPGTLFQVASSDIKPEIRIKAAERDAEYYILPGVTNNLQRIVLNTEKGEQSYTLQYTSDKNDVASVHFILPIGVDEHEMGLIQVECSDRERILTQALSTSPLVITSRASTLKETTTPPHTQFEQSTSSTQRTRISSLTSAEISTLSNQQKVTVDTTHSATSGTAVVIAVSVVVVIVIAGIFVGILLYVIRRNKAIPGNKKTSNCGPANSNHNYENMRQRAQSDNGSNKGENHNHQPEETGLYEPTGTVEHGTTGTVQLTEHGQYENVGKPEDLHKDTYQEAKQKQDNYVHLNLDKSDLGPCNQEYTALQLVQTTGNIGTQVDNL